MLRNFSPESPQKHLLRVTDIARRHDSHGMRWKDKYAAVVGISSGNEICPICKTLSFFRIAARNRPPRALWNRDSPPPLRHNLTMTRREAVRAAGGAALAVLGSGCAARRGSRSSAVQPPAPRLVPVNCTPERVIRTVAGLRPYRPSGFVVRTDRIGGKTIIHNYGHGGAGITLCWGTAQLALEEAERSGHTGFAVLGCGVIGLTTARLFQRRGFDVTIYTKDTTPNTTSDIAGGWWAPVTLFEPGREGRDFSAQFVRAAAFSHSYHQRLPGETYGIRWLPLYQLSNMPRGASTDAVLFPEIQELYRDSRELTPGQHPFAAAHVRRLWSMLIEPPIFLNALQRDYQLAGGRIVIREFANLDAVLALREPAIVNCTGLGAKALFGDPELTPVKGQLSFLIPQPELNYCTAGPGEIYMFPRRDGVALGGTHEEGVWDLEPQPQQTGRILREHAEVFRAVRAR